MERRISVRAVIVKDGKQFCVKLKNYKDNSTSDFWCTVGGGLDDGESLQDGLRREIVEEIGIEPVIGPLLYIQQFQMNGFEQLEFFFLVKNADDFEHIDLAKTTHGEHEIAEFAFIDNKENILPTFLKEESLENLENQPIKIFNYL